MIKHYLILLLHFLSFAIYADEDPCLFRTYCEDRRSGGRAGSQSIPSQAAVASLNPSELSNVKGFGLETIYQSGNPLLFNIASGTGKVGALISPNLEGSFFGNRQVEIDTYYLERYVSKEQYRTKKLSGGIGAKIFANKNFGLSFGLAAKRNPDIRVINFGGGISARLWLISLGAFVYHDDVRFNLGSFLSPYTNQPYSEYYGASTYIEKFLVKTFTFGTKISKLSLDVGMVKTKYSFYPNETKIYIYSFSYPIKKLLVNFAKRIEYSDNLSVINDELVIQRKKENYYLGLQYGLTKNIVLGFNYNYFLLKELSTTLIYYF